MAYSTKSDILEQLDEAVLIQLTDDDGIGAVDDDKVIRAIADADATIDAYCQGRYSVPLDPAPAKIRQIGVDIDIYNLYSRRGDAAPDIRQDRYKEAIRFLERVSDGKVTLGGDAPAQDSDGGPEATTAKSDRVFSGGRDSDSSSGTLDNY